jgi:hypothetical protein
MVTITRKTVARNSIALGVGLKAVSTIAIIIPTLNWPLDALYAKLRAITQQNVMQVSWPQLD